MSANALRPLAITITAFLPVFLPPVVVADVAQDLPQIRGSLGISVGIVFATAATTSPGVAIAAQRINAKHAWRLSVGLSATSLVIISQMQATYVLYIAMFVAGLGLAISNPLANRLTVHYSPTTLGLRLGIKQAAIPATSVVVGLFVPWAIATIHWRSLFAVAAAVTAAIAILGPDITSPTPKSASRPGGESKVPVSGSLVSIITAAAFAGAASTAMTVFFVPSMLMLGASIELAGAAFALLAAAVIAARFVFGWLGDRLASASIYRILVLMFCLGAVSYIALGATLSVSTFVWWSCIAFLSTWAWTGLFDLCVIRLSPAHAASLTGKAQLGLQFGAAAGPALFGMVMPVAGVRNAWMCMAGALIAAAVASIVGARVRD